jgi:hypothetical protein
MSVCIWPLEPEVVCPEIITNETRATKSEILKMFVFIDSTVDPPCKAAQANPEILPEEFWQESREPSKHDPSTTPGTRRAQADYKK